jgi:hypothetical protein
MLEGADHTYQVLRTQDVEPILDFTKGMNAIGAGNGKDLKHAAELPSIVVENYMNVNGVSFHEILNNPIHVERMCNDPALAAYRIWQGRV